MKKIKDEIARRPREQEILSGSPERAFRPAIQSAQGGELGNICGSRFRRKTWLHVSILVSGEQTGAKQRRT